LGSNLDLGNSPSRCDPFSKRNPQKLPILPGVSEGIVDKELRMEIEMASIPNICAYTSPQSSMSRDIFKK
jgi:hypothetical protein